MQYDEKVRRHIELVNSGGAGEFFSKVSSCYFDSERSAIAYEFSSENDAHEFAYEDITKPENWRREQDSRNQLKVIEYW